METTRPLKAWAWRLYIVTLHRSSKSANGEGSMVAPSIAEKVHSCDQERQSALEEARQNPREGIVIPECAPGGLYKPVQCHQSTGYCWCVLVDTGRPLPGTSTRYVMPSCESDARARSVEVDDPFKDRELPGCPEGKKMEFITSLLDALTTDMVQAINSAAPTGGGRFSEPDPSHTLEERVVHWYFSQLDSNSSNDINKREMKPFKRYVKKKAKPKKCARRFTDYCDLNKDKVISLPELKGCLGVSKEGECPPLCSWPARPPPPPSARGPRAPSIHEAQAPTSGCRGLAQWGSRWLLPLTRSAEETPPSREVQGQYPAVGKSRSSLPQPFTGTPVWAAQPDDRHGFLCAGQCLLSASSQSGQVLIPISRVQVQTQEFSDALGATQLGQQPPSGNLSPDPELCPLLKAS
ncbi:SPARC-related modular calcium-binding protein 1 [Galemys pyrenaicus]|uniref:SPARC-related modular calcium-binding protein 1 n=1 Tax=Galemys pyrenaicus TaxID=202257 RepID=A0A8J6AI00_GALPY|nr:SPARC-related modular calcium-binding protein 1 [Galemys pyrenaicus]